MRVLLISNGNGEDRIAVQLGQRWRESEAELALSALALVGSGAFYQQAGIPLLPPRFSPPSQGFAYLRPGLLATDFRAGLGAHLRASVACLRQEGSHFDYVLAVGDIVAAIAASLTGRPFAFYGAALSDHYLGPAGLAGASSYDPAQRWLLRRRRALVFARDALTARNLVRHGLQARFVGNPMRDCLDPPAGTGPVFDARPLILLLPGSHADAGANFTGLLARLGPYLDQPRNFAVLQAPQLAPTALRDRLLAAGWRPVEDGFERKRARLWLGSSHWLGTLLPRAKLAIGLAGTANEQCVGAGLPVISFATDGAQYSWAFGEAQQRLLGAGLCFLGQAGPAALEAAIARLLRPDAGRRQLLARLQAERFGPAGGDRRLIAAIRESLSGP